MRIILCLLMLIISSGLAFTDAFADHNENLIVSVENSSVNNSFISFQVVEVIIDDPDISDTSTVQTEPDVKVNGKKLRMAQATDGKWYAYVADVNYVKVADSTVLTAGNGFDFGEFCASTTASSELGIDISETFGVALARPYTGTTSSTNGDVTFVSCDGGSVSTGAQINNVVKNPPTLTSSGSVPLGQIGLTENIFPLIQLFNFNPSGNVVFDYNKNGNHQTVLTTFDKFRDQQMVTMNPDFITSTIPNMLTSNQKLRYSHLNIDPTAQDLWTFTTLSTDLGTYYNIFDENGMDKQIQTFNLLTLHDELGFEDEPEMRLNIDFFNVNLLDFMTIQSNGLQTLDETGGTTFLPSSSQIFTFKETEKNSGIFTNVDDDGVSNFYGEPVDPWSDVYDRDLGFCTNGKVYSAFSFYGNSNNTPVNDVCEGHSIPNGTTEDISQDFLFASNYGSHAIFSIESPPTHGIFQGTLPNLQYVPDENYFGQDEFTYKITIGSFSKTFTHLLAITGIQEIPTANAGSDQSVDPSSAVTLDGSQSLDVDGDSITYHWVQTSGSPVTLTDNTIATPLLTTPSTGDTLSFMLTVSDGIATSNPDVVNIYVGSPVPDPIPPPPPSALSTTSLDGSVSISWQPPSDNGGETITDYIIEYKKELDSTWLVYDDATTPTTTTTISGLTNDENYQFRISSVSLAGVGDTSSLISETPVELIIETVEPTPETTPEPIVETTPEPIVETTPEPIVETTEFKEILSFVDASKDPQSYIERYVTEPTYKEWFDTNFPDYTLYEGIGISEDEYLRIIDVINNPAVMPVDSTIVDQPVDTKSEEIIADPEIISEIQDPKPSCGAGTKDVNGICVLIESQLKSEPTCGAGTIEKDGICVVDQNQNAQDSSVPKSDFFGSFIKMFSSWFG